MEWQQQFIELMRAQLAERQARDPKYSVRRFAKDMRVSSSAMSEILRGSHRWKLTSKRAAEIVRMLGLPPERIRRLLEILNDPDVRVREPLVKEPPALYTDWLYLVVLTSFNLADPQLRSPESLSYRLAEPVERIQAVIDELLRDGYLQRLETGEVVKVPRSLIGGDGPSSEMVRAYHRESLRMAIRAVDEIAPNRRDLSSMTFIGNSQRLDEIRAELRSMHERIINLMEDDGKGAGNDEVYRLSISLYPMNFSKEKDLK